MGDRKDKGATADPQTPPAPAATIGTVDTTGNTSATSVNDTDTVSAPSQASSLDSQEDEGHGDEDERTQAQQENDDQHRAPSVADSNAPSTGIEADIFDDDDDDAYAQSTSTSYLTSIASDIRRGIEENGRLYAAYGMHKAWLPIDDAEVGNDRVLTLSQPDLETNMGVRLETARSQRPSALQAHIIAGKQALHCPDRRQPAKYSRSRNRLRYLGHGCR